MILSSLSRKTALKTENWTEIIKIKQEFPSMMDLFLKTIGILQADCREKMLPRLQNNF